MRVCVSPKTHSCSLIVLSGPPQNVRVTPLANSSMVRITWSPPASLQNGIVQEYRVRKGTLVEGWGAAYLSGKRDSCLFVCVCVLDLVRGE